MYKNILLCICLGFLSCCSSTEENTISVSGIYYVTSGYQTLTDSTGRNDRYDFTPEDGIFLTVSQGGKSCIQHWLSWGIMWKCCRLYSDICRARRRFRGILR